MAELGDLDSAAAEVALSLAPRRILQGASIRMKPSRLTLSRWSWFFVVGGFFGARDMCAGNGGPPPPDPQPPADAGPADAQDDGAMSLLAPARPAARAPAHARAITSTNKRAQARARTRGPV